MYLFT